MFRMLRKVIVLVIIAFCFPVIQTKHKILKTESIIHLKFFDHCLDLYGNDQTSNVIRIKGSLFNLADKTQTDNDIKIFVLNEKQSHFERQQEFGHLYDPKEFVLLSINVTNIEKSSVVIELFKNESENWKLFSSAYLTPFEKTGTDEQIITAVVDTNHNLIGEMKIDYLMIRPINHFNADADNMIDIKPGAMMGHRGTGVGRRTDIKENILENTIEAFNYACHHNADMIELDIQLSNDKIPIIHHDFSAKLLSREKTGNEFHVTEVATKDLSYNQMTKISTVENKDFDYEDNQPFQTLKAVLQKVEPKCGINFEIKYPQQKIDKTWEGIKGLDLNEYIDIILETLYENIGNRTGIITSFHPDLCVMLHLKQNKFRVALLTSGDVVHWNPKANPYLDPRATSIPLNTYFAKGMQLNGLSIYAKDLLANSSLIEFVKSHNQSVYVWGNQLNNKEVLENLIKEGVDGLIFDNIDKLLSNQSNAGDSDTNSGNIQKNEIFIILLIAFIFCF